MEEGPLDSAAPAFADHLTSTDGTNIHASRKSSGGQGTAAPAVAGNLFDRGHYQLTHRLPPSSWVIRAHATSANCRLQTMQRVSNVAFVAEFRRC
jgi:hypothetical protein